MDKTNEEEDEDLYSDLPNFKYDETIDKIQSRNKELHTHVAHLEELMLKQKKELEEYRSTCGILTKNISSLLKTAQNEIKRKDKKIDELNKAVLELKTEVLTSRKRKCNDFSSRMKPLPHEQAIFKQQKLQSGTSVKPLSPGYSKISILDKETNSEEDFTESGEPESPVLPEKQIVPDIKCHTVYSKRMYNKIYNLGNKSSTYLPCPDSINGTVGIETNNVLKEKEDESNANSVVENKSMSKLVTPNSKNLLHEDNRYQANTNLQERTTDLNHDKIQKNKETLVDEKSVFSALENSKHLISNNNKSCCTGSVSNTKDIKQMTLISRTNSTKINTENVNCVNKIMSLVQDNSINNSFHDKLLTSSDSVKEKKQLVISKTNRLVNFSKTENVSQAFHVKHFTKNSSTIISDKKVSNIENLNILDKINSGCKLNNEQSKQKGNSIETSGPGENMKKQFTKSHCSRKAKKSVKNVICPISGQWGKIGKPVSVDGAKEANSYREFSPNRKNENENVDIIEALFGSPLKWTENSVDDMKQVKKLSPPATAFEDSCSAHIENVKFKKVENNNADVFQSKVTELSSTKKFSYTERKCCFQPSGSEADNILSSYHDKNEADVTSCKDVLKCSSSVHWPFRKSSNEIPSKNRSVTSPTFSSFVNTDTTSEACDVPSLKCNSITVDVHVPIKLLKSPKYSDSVLGQFDDTTQLINALAKDPSKLSPIHTPVKETKLDSTNNRTPFMYVEKSVLSPLVSSVCKNPLVPSGPPTSIEKEVSLPIELISSVDNNISVSTPQVSPSNKKSTSPFKKVSAHSTLILPEKKISISAAVISSVQKRLSVPSIVERKVEKKTILLEQPINILCPRKTPRQIGRYKQSDTPKKQNLVSVGYRANQSGQREHTEIKSPSPLIERSLKTDPPSTCEILVNDINKNDGVDENLKNVDNKIMAHSKSSSEEKNRSSKSPSNVHCVYNDETAGNSNNVTPRRISGDRNNTMSSRLPLREDHSPANEKSHHSSSRKENIPSRKETRSPSRKENSSFRLKRDKWPIRWEAKQHVFKRPVLRKESFKRPNCHFRQTSVERKVAKDWRHSSRPRKIMIKTIKAAETTINLPSRVYNNNFDKKFISQDKQVITVPKKTPVISRSSRISWSASTDVVSTKTSNAQTNSDSMRISPSSPHIKWVLTPIDLVKSSNMYREANVKIVPEENVKTLVSSKNEGETPVCKSSFSEPSLVSPESNSPSKNKNIVIVAEKRPIKFGSNN